MKNSFKIERVHPVVWRRRLPETLLLEVINSAVLVHSRRPTVGNSIILKLFPLIKCRRFVTAMTHFRSFARFTFKKLSLNENASQRRRKKTVCIRTTERKKSKNKRKITSCLACFGARIGSSISCISWMLLCATLTQPSAATNLLDLESAIKYRL